MTIRIFPFFLIKGNAGDPKGELLHLMAPLANKYSISFCTMFGTYLGDVKTAYQ